MELAQAAPPAPARRAHPGYYLLGIMLALIGGVLGIIGAVFEELRVGFSPLIFVVGAPIIEEVLKPSGIYIGVARWAFAFKNQLWVAFLTSISGLVFGVIESLVYVTVYNPDHTRAFFLFRFTVTPMLHMTTSFIAGCGINPRLLAWMNRGGPFPRRSRNAFLAAIGLHALYNATAVALSIAGVLDFD